MEVDVDRARDPRHPGGEVERDLVRGLWLYPVTWTSIGAGSPKFRIWLTMSAGWKKKVTPGNSRGSVSRSVFIQRAVG